MEEIRVQMSRTLLYTGHDKAYNPLAAITVPRMAGYALRHNMYFKCHTEPLIDVPNGIYWTGVCGALQAFEKGYERAIYLDVDQLITNFDVVPLPKSMNGFHASRDWGEDAVKPWQFSMCGFVVFPSTEAMLSAVLKSEPEWRDKPFPEQGPMQDAIRDCMVKTPEANSFFGDGSGYFKPELERMVNVHPRKVFNCVPDAVCPGNVPEPWQPGDWCAHLTMISLEDRVKLAKEILSKL